jgi:membrane-bound serine protease (ClpP class)
MRHLATCRPYGAHLEFPYAFPALTRWATSIAPFGLKVLLVAAVAAILASATAEAQVVRVVVDDMIHPVTEEYVQRAIDRAKETKAQAVLIELNTPGGLSSSTRKIVEQIIASPVPVIVYVTPSGARAASAGFFILQAADIAAMAPGTNTGAASEVIIGGVKVDERMRKKMDEDTAAFMRSFVAKRGRNVEAAEKAVTEAKAYTEEEALKANLIEAVAATRAELFQQIKARQFKRFAGEPAKLDLVDAKVETLELTLKQRLASALMNPNLVFLLFAIGLLAIYAEFNNPGAILPGVIGLICVLLAVFALNILPTRFAAIGLILGAFVLFALEAKFTSHGILGAGGVLLLVLGGLLLVDGPIPEMRVGLWTALSVAIPMGLITVFLMTLVLKAQRSKVTTGAEGMIGELGVVRTPLMPEGKIFVHGELWNAVAPGEVNVGERVVVTKVNGLLLEVEKVK